MNIKMNIFASLYADYTSEQKHSHLIRFIRKHDIPLAKYEIILFLH